jgi:hypothetical protein
MTRHQHSPCAEPGCPELTTTTRCPTHTRQADAARGTTTARGYGNQHQAARRRWAPRVATGTIRCARCGQRIRPGQPWDLDHTDDRRGYRGPSHLSCNRAR